MPYEVKPALLPFIIVMPATRTFLLMRMTSLIPCASSITSAGLPVSPNTCAGLLDDEPLNAMAPLR